MWWVFRTTKDGEKRQRCFDDRDMMVAVGPDGRMDSRAAEKCDFFTGTEMEEEDRQNQTRAINKDNENENG